MTSDTRPDVLALENALAVAEDEGDVQAAIEVVPPRPLPERGAQIIAALNANGWRLTNEAQAPDESVGRLREEKVTRFEIIDHRSAGWGGDAGRVFVAMPCRVELAYQDGGRTLKVFVTDAQHGPISPARPVEPPDPDIVWLETDLLERLASKDDQIARLTEALRHARGQIDVPNGNHVIAEIDAALASQPDIAARRDCDDCYRTDGTHDPGVEH